MARRLRIFLVLILLGTGPLAAASDAFLGKWLFHKMIYQGQLVDPLNPNLVLTLEFHSGRNTLAWHRTDEKGFCEREALWTYSFTDSILYQKVVWVNPQNRSDCSKDSDMQMGQESWSPVKIVKEQLFLNLPLGDADITMIWKKIP